LSINKNKPQAGFVCQYRTSPVIGQGFWLKPAGRVRRSNR